MKFNPEQYRDNAAFALTEEQQELILNWFAAKQYCLERERGKSDKTRYNSLSDQMHSVMEVLEYMGIMIDYDWPGNRRYQWFFPTYDEALLYEEWLYCCGEE